MNILILGGSGFVGTRLTELLIKDHQVTIGDLVKSEFYPELWKHCDVCIDDDLRAVMPGNDCIINLAASHRDDVRPLSLYTRNNVEGAEHVCKIATELGIHLIVFTSSVAIYGFPEYEYDEDTLSTNTVGQNFLPKRCTRNGNSPIRGTCFMLSARRSSSANATAATFTTSLINLPPVAS